MVSPSAPEILDVIGEMRLFLLTNEQLMDSNVIKLWFSERLSGFLPSASEMFLLCLSSRNLSCQSYHQIVQVFSRQFRDMTFQQQQTVLRDFILRFLSEPHTGPGCVSTSNSSAQWLTDNLGSFSELLSVSKMFDLNPQFNPIEALSVLSPKQSAELLVLKYPTLPNTDVIINKLFDYFTESPRERKFTEFLSFLVVFLEMGNVSCPSYKTLFTRLDNTSTTSFLDIASSIMDTKLALTNYIPAGCIIYTGQCNVTMVNEADICFGVNSTELQLQLDSGKMNGRFCEFPVEEFACASLSALRAEDLAAVMKCGPSSSLNESKPVWKLLLVKSTRVLDEALDLLANTTFDPSSPSVSVILDGIREIRLDLFSTDALNNPSMLQLWFNRRLHPFLPAVSTDFLSCLATKELQCSSYQFILQSLSLAQTQMNPSTQMSVSTDFIQVYLSRNDTAGCLSASISSAQWLRINLGSFSEFASVSELFNLYPQFNPIEALSVLSPKQSAELLVLKYPTLPNTDVIINKLFDYFTESPRERKFTEFLSFLVVFLEMGTLSCTSYKTLFTQLDYIEATASLDVASFIPSVRANLSKNILPGCAIFSGECNVVTANESNVCVGVNSTELQLQLNSGKMGGRFCDFSVEEFACASLSALTAQDLAEILKCNRSSSSSGSTQVWKLLLNKASGVLDAALDLLTNSTINPMNPSASMILDSIQEIKLDQFSNDTLNDPLTLQLWFNNRLRPFLSAVSNDFLSCLSTKDLQCSSYQYIVQILSQVQPQMALPRQISVYTNFIKIYLKRNNTADPGCIFNINSSSEWLQNNVGGFSVLLSIQDFQELYPQFSAMEALSFLSIRQLAEVFITTGQITTIDQVTMVMSYVPDQQLGSFFDNFSPAILGREYILPSTVRSAMLQVVFYRANLSSQSVSDAIVSLWLQVRLRPLLVNLAPYHVAPYFQILSGRNCSIEQQGVNLLNQTISSLSNDTQTEIQSRIIQALQGPSPLRCYGDNYSYSFYSFLRSSFLGFQFPNLTTFLSLIPPDRNQQLINSMPPSDLGDFLRHTNVVGQESQLCQLYSSYLQIPVFLETESLPEQVRQRTLPCVWPIALRSSSRSEVNAWFDRGLPNYLVFLTKTQINQITSINASCLAFQKIVSALGSYNYSVTDFTNQDVYNTIKVYLSSATSPKCYDSNNPELNSTAWFAEYIGSFITFLTVVDLQSFGSQQDLQLFTVNPQNLLLLNQYKVDVTIVIYYIHLVYQQDINFSPLGLPSLGQCFAPGRVFTQLTSQESLTVLGNVNRVCTDLDPQIAAALASNFGENIDAKVISALGNESTSLSISQIKSLKPSDLVDSLNILSNVIGWRIGQAKAIVLSLLTSGSVQINSSASLLNLGSLISGVPSTVFSSISGSDLVTVSRNPSVLFYILSAPQIVQLTFVIQIIYLNTNSLHIIENVPDNLATEIPGVYLLQFPNDSSTVIKLNRKKWKPQQVALFFDIIAANSETAELGGPNNLSSSVLQGFTCTTIRSLGKRQIKNLIKACRRKGTNKVPLVETQLTCMYNQIKDESDATSFSLYPPDVLLYYDYSLVPQSSCRSYFQELADADFSIFSPALTYKRSALFDNARSCLGITSTSLSEDNVSVLGNMCCILDGSYIQNSHPSILEQLKNCPDLTVGQSAAVETLLTNGNTPYGLSSTWNEQTLKDLGMLTLHLPSSFYQHFDQDTKRNFLKYFLKVFGGVSREQRRQLKKEIRQSIKSDSEQTAECTVGIITQVTISDPTFPFDYNINQFNNCLSVSTVKDNLDAITEKVDEVEYLRIVLQKLQEADNSIIPEDQIQLLSAASRVATVQDILSWTISKIDTLAALMDSSNGGWDPSLAKVIISKYLAVGGNKLGSAELNVIGGPNLCSLDVDVIRTISSQSFREVDSLDISSCTADKKKEFFTISFEAFNLTTSSVSVFQLIQPYIGGANVNYIRSLVVSDVNMDLATFTSLDENVVLSLNARQVKAVLGTNLPDLKSYENQTLVQTWIRSQNQSELDILGLGIRGGKVDPPIPPYYSSTTTLVPTTTNTTEFKPSPASTTEPPTSISASTLSPTTTNVTEFNPSPASTTEPPTSSSASTLSPTTTNVTEFNPSPASTTEPPTSSSASTLSPTRTNVTEFNPSPASTTEPPTSIPTSTLSPTTTNVTEFNPSPASTTEPPTSSSASTLSPTTTNVTEFHPSPASTTEPPTSSSASTLSPTTTNVTEFNPSPASTTEPPTSIPTSTSSPTTTNVTEFNPSPASTTEPPTSSSASTLSPTTTNVTEFHPSPASTTEPPTSIPTSTLSPTTTNVTEFNPSPASTTESPTSIPTSTSSPTTTNVTEFNPSPPSTAKPTTAGSTTTTSTTNIISGTTRLPTVLSSTTTSQPPSRTSTSTTTVLPTDIYTVQCQVIAANESNTCIGVNSTGLQVYLDSGKMNGRFCNFSVEEFACASLSALTAQDLVEIMTCDLSSNSSGSISAWNLLFCKTSRILNAALNLLTTATINPNNPAVSVILDSIQAISPDLFSTNTLNNLTELQLLFNVRLRPFLPAVSTNFLSILAMKDLQCSSYQYIVQIFSKVQPQMTLSKQESVYTQFIKIYLSRKNTAAPKCYDSNNPELKSTAWFAEYISSFITFLTVVDLKSFGSEQVLQVFTVNPLNIALLSQPNVDLTLISYYTQLVYQQVSNFNPLLLPSVSQCYAPGPVFTQLNATVSMTVYEALNEVCTSLDEQISATLISNFGNTIGSNVIAAIGNGSASLSTSQIKTITALELMKSLSTLSIVTGWREGQAKIIMQTLLTLMKINSSSSLSQLGTLVIGLPSNTFSSIISSELIAAAKNPLFVANMLNAAQILQQSFVYQIVISNLISLNIIDNVPDQLATQIPRVYLQQFTGDDIIKLNKKTWKREQVELFFDVIAAGSATTVLGSPNSLSSSVLQGFTCTGVSQFERKQVTDLVKACRRKGLNKVPLLETQLTCMYNYIRTDPDVTKFDLYPPDVLLYYDYSLVPQSSCRSYFQELADADFSVFSSVLSYKLTALFDNARSCLGITNTSLTEDNVSVLGNMCCMLDGSYIKSSDPSILKKLKNCPDLTADQAAAVVTLLTNGNTQYGTPSKWNQTTLTDLGMLPLYLPTSFYDNFDKSTKVTFLKSFLKVIKDDKVSRDKRRQLKEVIRQSIKNRSKRSTDCTVGNITQVTISDSTFPLDYDVTQFNNCLSNTVVKDNFDAITEKVDEKDYLKIVLQKLGEAYNFVVPEDQVQVLGPASRVATIDDIRSWTITQVDTLSALMDSSNGDWNSSLAKVIISKYLAVAGNSLGRAELNAIKGPNLCSLDLSVIQSISSQNLKEAEALNVISCTLEAKKKLFNISSQSFRAVTQSSSSYQLMKQFLGGAPLDYIRGLVSSNISMDLETFSNLDPNIVPSLTVNEVKGLLGTNLPDLKSYENQPLVQAWIRSQLQSELDTLGLNLSGGRADPVTTATLTTTAGTVTAGSGGSVTTGSGVRIQADAGFSFFSFLAILITSQLITI
ncbi:uncharacterized protein LOC101168922 isoform X2 [Oryzias latipes]|uniref:uncharacterized protein LOC101168922 isoform X2 n=1 Tax=Oryzias latipes TaxID=8090 RepID=UPI000CE1BF2D|nr:uncharacterized protein LOC101168922 isoform X2 [Oryzias latipes]